MQYTVDSLLTTSPIVGKTDTSASRLPVQTVKDREFTFVAISAAVSATHGLVDLGTRPVAHGGGRGRHWRTLAARVCECGCQFS